MEKGEVDGLHTHAAMSVKCEICPLWFRQLWRTGRQAWYGRQGRFPHEKRGSVHQDTSKSLCGTRQMKEVEWVKMTEYLGVMDIYMR